MDTSPDFARISRRLRDEIIEHYREQEESIEGDAGLRTLETNSSLVPERAELMLDLIRHRSGRHSIRGFDLLDLGCGFGAMSVYLAAAGANVTAIDPKRERLEVGERVATEFGLPATFRQAWAEALPLPDRSFDLILLNNSFCYVTDGGDRRAALGHMFRIARPGARLAMRNPSRGSPFDPFTGLPLVHQVPGPLAKPVLKLTERGRTRSKVRMPTAATAARELREAGFDEVRHERAASEQRPARYQHMTAHRPLEEAETVPGAS